jgi:hypothetical protein
LSFYFVFLGGGKMKIVMERRIETKGGCCFPFFSTKQIDLCAGVNPMIFWLVFLMLQGEKGAEQEETHAEARLYFALFCKANFAFVSCAPYILE